MKLFQKNKKVFIFILSIVFIFLVVSILLSTSKSKIGILGNLNDLDSLVMPPNIVEAISPGMNDKLNSGIPAKLRIPKINIDADVIQVALTSGGFMDAPSGPDEVGWYNLGPYPGEIGNAVIDGHSGWKGGKKAVFDDLYKLSIGDKVYVESDGGVLTTFTVKKISKYTPNADAKDVFISTDGKIHLNLITCTGFWNNILKSHSSRLVVFTDKE